jgi:cellulose biosynthesis protein BcsQ
MAKRIALFNHKGGVSKTTTTFNLGWMLASKGKRVILVDTDPQCNLTGMVLGYKSSGELERFYTTESERNIRSALASSFESRPKLIEAVDCISVDGQDGLFLLPGHIRFAEYEVTLGIAQELSGSIQTLQNLPGSIAYLLDKTAEKFNADYVLIDMSPSLSSINQNLLMTSHFFMLPTSPDYFSVMAIDSLATVLPKWYNWSKKAQNFQMLQEASYPFPKITPKFLGTIVQKYRPRGGVPANAFQNWIDQIQATVKNRLVPILRENEMMLDQGVYGNELAESGYCLASISDFNSLIAKSQQTQTPVFALSRKQLGQRGGALNNTIASRDRFNQTFEELGNRIIGLINDATSN